MNIHTTSDNELFYILKLIRSENVGTRTFYALIDFFGSPKKAVSGVVEMATKATNKRSIRLATDAEIEQEIKAVEKFGAGLISYKSPLYPSLLRHIPDPPPVLTYKGNIALLEQTTVAIVGARNASINGCVFAKKLAAELAATNHVIVSGLAKGIDSAAHLASFPNTVAIIAGGIDHIYPKENTNLYNKICSEGLMLAENKIGTNPTAQHFPQRNRIISGISYGTVVIEASLKSGSLITARFALEQNREVFAVPGFPLDPRSFGTNKLLKEGAILVESADDIINSLSSAKLERSDLTDMNNNAINNIEAPKLMPEITDEMRHLVTSGLSSTPIEIDELRQQLDLPITAIHVIILELELAGKAIRHPGNRISLLFEL